MVLLSGLLVASCGDGNRQLSEADKSAFGTSVDSLDSDVQGIPIVIKMIIII